MITSILLYIILGFVILPLLWKYSEISLALFLTAGLFKATPQLENLFPEFFDLTVFFGAIVVLVILKNVLKKKWHIVRISSKLFLPYLGIAVLMFLSLTYTSASTYGAEKFFKFITLTALAAFGPLFLFKNETILKRFFYMIIGLSTLTSIAALISGRSGEVVLAFSADYLTLGIISGITVIITLFYFMRGKNIKKQLLWSTVLLINLFSLVYIAARAPLLILILTVILMLLFSFNIQRFSVNKSAFVFVIVVILLIGLSFLVFPEFTQISLLRIKGIFSAPGEISPIEERLGMFSTALKGLYLHPVAGLGVGGFQNFALNEKGWVYPHNILLETGSELGFFGLILLILLIGFSFFHLLHLKKNKPKKYILTNTILALFIFTFLDAMLSGGINTVRFLFIWIGVAYALNNILRPQKSRYLQSKKSYKYSK
ncbi:O-antigen ligase family protein [Patescibacteria group bacterium AH-259-L05]|nr:O-antigen ligase family protein [Patescibacteria group bacterium AH-259-L05]